MINKNNLMLLCWLLTPITLAFLVSQILQPIYTNKYLIISSIPLYLLVSNGLNNVPNLLVKNLIITLVVCISLVEISDYHTMIKKEQWRETAEFIEANALDNDLLLFNSGSTIHLVFDYYAKRADLIKIGFPKNTKVVDEDNIRQLGPIIKNHNRVWVILSHSRDEKGLINEKLNRSYQLNYQKKYQGIRVYLFEK